jgi:hypothetical protein
MPIGRNRPRRWEGGVSMKTAAEFRAMAEECVKWAGEAYTDEVRQPLLQLAQIWLDTASQVDGLPATWIAPISKWPGYLFPSISSRS